ncbi:MAG: hypothetical protein EBR09_13745 [Proteobacteria bacterium]|nr:hypothetical protein [Pseudomonadota bacterium]
MKLMKTAVSFSVAGLLAVAIFAFQSCGSRAARVVRMKVGETVVVTPIPAMNLSSDLPAKPPQKVLLRFMSGGKEITPSSDAEISFFENMEATEAFYAIKAADFPVLHLQTKCSSGDVALLDNAVESDVLICDGSLDLRKAGRIDIKFPDGKLKSATGVLPESTESDLFVGHVTFF